MIIVKGGIYMLISIHTLTRRVTEWDDTVQAAKQFQSTPSHGG